MHRSDIIIRHCHLPTGAESNKYSAIRRVRRVRLHLIGKLGIRGISDIIHRLNLIQATLNNIIMILPQAGLGDSCTSDPG